MARTMWNGMPHHSGLSQFVLMVLAMDALGRSANTVFPSWSSRAICLAGFCYLGYKIITFKRWNDETRFLPRFLLWFLVMIVELTVENCMVWLVSASDSRKYENVQGLQDNVERAVSILSTRMPMLYWFATLHWANVMHFLLSLLALAFSVAFGDQVPYSGFGLMARTLATIAASRVIRIACFMSTVLPSPRPGCYQQRFPPVPETAWEAILAGYTTIRGFGGCNDLIFSGHAAFMVLAPLAHMTYYRPDGISRFMSFVSTAMLWLALIQACLRDVMEHHHYSVDMILAVVVTWACWSWLEFVYPAAEKLPARAPGSAADGINIWVLLVIVVALCIAGVIVIGGKA